MLTPDSEPATLSPEAPTMLRFQGVVTSIGPMSNQFAGGVAGTVSRAEAD